MSCWSRERLERLEQLGASVVAVQETKLAEVPLGWAKASARACGWQLHHGCPTRVRAGTQATVRGNSRGVGLLAAEGVAVTAVRPQGEAWQRLHRAGRLHAVRLPPRPGLPGGLLVMSAYAPVQGAEDRGEWVRDIQEVVHGLDMQEPFLLVGDFNGTVDPERDMGSGARGAVCPALAGLLGPGGPLIDALVAVSPAEHGWTFTGRGPADAVKGSRCDLVLVNRRALALVVRVWVASALGEVGGHAPVVVHLRAPEGIRVDWKSPRRRLPEVMRLTEYQLRVHAGWAKLAKEWAEDLREELAECGKCEAVSELSRRLEAAMQALVERAGGWSERAAGRRKAYDTEAVRRWRKGREEALLVAKEVVRERRARGPGAAALGCWPHRLEAQIRQARRQGLEVAPGASLDDVEAACVRRALECARGLAREVGHMRKERTKRWAAKLPQLWKDCPGAVYGWLKEESVSWGSVPVVRADGTQCISVEEVDEEMRAYWVRGIWSRHAMVDEARAWAAFAGSEFGRHVPKAQWPCEPWTGQRVRQLVGGIRAGSSAGERGVPLAVWKHMPEPWYEGVARLLTLVERDGEWPEEVVNAFVVMIPKGGERVGPQDQRPITVLDVVYRLWAKGQVVQWAPVLQREILSQGVMGFRAGMGTAHVAQAVQDLMRLQRARGQPLWIASFDVEKCYPTVPWWALFGVARGAGMPEQVVRGFRRFYEQLRCRFRYGQREGERWGMGNGLAQGCPAAPDLANLLNEPLLRWAAATGRGVRLDTGEMVALLSYADDLVATATSLEELNHLVEGIQRWFALLGVRVNLRKTQVWTNVAEVAPAGGHRAVVVAGQEVPVRPTFRVVGIELGEDERLTTAVHVAPRMEKAMRVAARLRALETPAAITAVMWKTAVVPVAIYGCELRDYVEEELHPLTMRGRAAVCRKRGLDLAIWRAPEVLHGVPLGETAVQDPYVETRKRQARWLLVLAHDRGVAGRLHRELVSRGAVAGLWAEPRGALRSTLAYWGWTVRVNWASALVRAWPVMAAEMPYRGRVSKEPGPRDGRPAEGAVWTDGSVKAPWGGAAAVSMAGWVAQLRVPEPGSSTRVEMIALGLPGRAGRCPPEIYTDSRGCLDLVEGWAGKSAAAVLHCAARQDVRRFLAAYEHVEAPPHLMKVKAHDEEAVRRGWPIPVGNHLADGEANEARGEGVEEYSPDVRYADPVGLWDGGTCVSVDVERAMGERAWRRARAGVMARPAGVRTWLKALYREADPIDWTASTGVLRRPLGGKEGWHHRTKADFDTAKWVARVRAGAMATQRRLFHTGTRGDVPATCPLCGDGEEDDAHVLAGCVATGADGWLAAVREAWDRARGPVGRSMPATWGERHKWQLLAAMVPEGADELMPEVPEDERVGKRAALHVNLAKHLHELCRRRELMRKAKAEAEPGAEGRGGRAGQFGEAEANPERDLTLAELRDLERERQQRERDGAEAEPAPPPRELQRKGEWLRERLVRFVREATVNCVGREPVEDLRRGFEAVTGVAFGLHHGVGVTARGTTFLAAWKALGVAHPELTTAAVRTRPGGRCVWLCDRKLAAGVPPGADDAEAQDLTDKEARAVIRADRAAVRLDLAGWVRRAPVRPAGDGMRGEPTAVLMALWESMAGREYPSDADRVIDRWKMFARDLTAAVVGDEELRGWLTAASVRRPLSPGLAPMEQLHWRVVVEPGEEGFVLRWKDTLRAIVRSEGLEAMHQRTQRGDRKRPRVEEEEVEGGEEGSGGEQGPPRRRAAVGSRGAVGRGEGRVGRGERAQGRGGAARGARHGRASGVPGDEEALVVRSAC